MSDLGDRLRRWSMTDTRADIIDRMRTAADIIDAQAKEIAALQVAVQDRSDLIAKAQESLAGMQGVLRENEALRAALNKIAERTSSEDPCRGLVQIARDALAYPAR